jgi:undecaprenyl-diphosphatase
MHGDREGRKDMVSEKQTRARDWRTFMRWLMLGFVGAAMMMYVMSQLQFNLYREGFARVDAAIMSTVHGWTSPAMTRLMLFLTRLGAWYVMLPLTTLVVIRLLRHGYWRDAVGLGVGNGIGWGVNEVLKQMFRRERPDVEWALAQHETFSYPSGHAMSAMILFGLLAYIVAHRILTPARRETGEYAHPRGRYAAVAAVLLAAAAFIVGIGLSRVYLGVHYPTDVWSGYAAGFVWMMAAMRATRAIHPHG